MSRFSGPKHRGAARDLAVVRRAEAEERQAAERARDEARAAAMSPARPLTDREAAELMAAVGALLAAREWADFTRNLTGRTER